MALNLLQATRCPVEVPCSGVDPSTGTLTNLYDSASCVRRHFWSRWAVASETFALAPSQQNNFKRRALSGKDLQRYRVFLSIRGTVCGYGTALLLCITRTARTDTAEELSIVLSSAYSVVCVWEGGDTLRVYYDGTSNVLRRPCDQYTKHYIGRPEQVSSWKRTVVVYTGEVLENLAHC